MSSRIQTILILGATGGIGEALARKFHAQGKKVIVTGRREHKLQRLAQDLPGLETRVWDLADIPKLKANVQSILADFPNLDTVFVNAGIQNHYNVFYGGQAEKEVIGEINTNLTAPILLAEAFAPHLLKLAQEGTKTNLFITSSSLAYIPLAFYPTYCATKAGISAYVKILRMQLAYTGATNCNIVEVVPPYVDTELNAAHREQTDALQGGKDKAYPPMPLKEYIDTFFQNLEQTEADGSLKKEIGVGFGAQGVELWRGTFPKVYEAQGMTV